MKRSTVTQMCERNTDTYAFMRVSCAWGRLGYDCQLRLHGSLTKSVNVKRTTVGAERDYTYNNTPSNRVI